MGSQMSNLESSVIVAELDEKIETACAALHAGIAAGQAR
jgi:hypothetical protein